MTAPTSSSCASSSALPRDARQPGTDSSLSSVPPVWPSPRPDSCGTATPQAATSGASGRGILSPTPPGEGLSAGGRGGPGEVLAPPAGGVLVGGRSREPGEVHPLPRRDHRCRPALDLTPSHAVEQD